MSDLIDVDRIQYLVPALDGGDDFGLGVVVGLAQEAVDAGLQFDDRAEDAALEPPPGQFGDEKSQNQALDRTPPGLPLTRGRAGTMTHDYKRNGATPLFAALILAPPPDSRPSREGGIPFRILPSGFIH